MADRRQSVDTPTRVAREEERKMLEKLNGRLEAFIARLRQIEEENKQLTSKLAATQETALRKEEDMRQRHEAEVAGLRDEKYNDTKLIAEQKATIHELQGHLTTARSEASTNKGAAQQLQKVQAQLLSLQSERDMLQVSVDEATAKLQATEAKLQLAEKAAKAHEQKLAPLRENLTNIEEMRKKENAAFRDQLAELRAAHQKELDEKRASFETQLMEALETQKTNLEAQQDQQRAELSKHFAEVEGSLAASLREEKKARESAAQQAKSSKEALDRLAKQADEATRRVRALEEELKNTTMTYEGRVSSLSDELQHARSRRDENAADLNTAKQELVLLQQGLKRYDYLITNGETRIRTLSPAAASGKKRRREHLGPRLYVSKLDLDNDAFTVANAGDDDASLAGYKVRSVHDENVTFEFGDDHVLASGEEVTVYSGKKNAKRKLAGNTLFWTQRYIWKNEGDTAILFDPNDEEVSRLDATAHTVALGSPPGGLDFSDGDQGKGFCAVM